MESISGQELFIFREKTVHEGGSKAYNNQSFLVTVWDPPNAKDYVWQTPSICPDGEGKIIFISG